MLAAEDWKSDRDGASIGSMTRNRKSWVVVIVFWTLFLGSIGLDPRYPWIHLAWNGLCLAFLVVAAVYSVIEMFCRGNETGHYAYYRGVPRCLWFIVASDEDYEKYAKPATKQRDD